MLNIVRTSIDIDVPILREIRAVREREGRSLGAIISELLSEALAGLSGRVCFAIASAADKERKERPMAQHERLPKTKSSAIFHVAEPSPRRGVLSATSRAVEEQANQRHAKL
jgi:L-aminopeptidase/D-esterase-like protein